MFQEKVEQVNHLLSSQGNAIIQRKQIGGQPALYGYKPQYLIDAVNQVFGPENWYYELYESNVFPASENGESGQVIVKLELFMREREDCEFFSHGIQFGQSTIVHKNVGDATKGAVTDAIGKGFSLFSIGAAAYRGELESVFKGDVTYEAPPPQNGVIENSPEESESGENMLPPLPNVIYEPDGNGLVFAKGDTYENRNLLKRLGFKWYPEHKAWGIEGIAV
jgi:hypothetical protein